MKVLKAPENQSSNLKLIASKALPYSINFKLSNSKQTSATKAFNLYSSLFINISSLKKLHSTVNSGQHI